MGITDIPKKKIKTGTHLNILYGVNESCSKSTVPMRSPSKDVKIDHKNMHLLAPDARLKLTIISLSGIHVRAHEPQYANCTNNLQEQRRSAQNFAITASVSFTGSCNPADMHVVSSGLCSATGRLFVESRPICVPNGMTDGLIAQWDDSPKPSYFHHQGSLYSTDTTIFGKQSGSILACPSAKPHLFVDLKDNEQEDLRMIHSNLGLTQDLTSLSSLSYGPDMDETDVSTHPSLRSNGTRAADLEVIREAASSPDFISNQTLPRDNTGTSDSQTGIEQRRESPEPSTPKHNMGGTDFNCAIINTPSETIETSSVPEILEMHVALHINQVPTHNPAEGEYEYENENENAVKSSCVPTDEGNGAIAHLVLFPDILNEDVEQRGSGNGGKSGTSRIFELPVRKRFSPMMRSSSSISGLTRGGDTEFSGRSRRGKRSVHDPEAFVDLGEDATIRVKLELCTEQDVDTLDRTDSFHVDCAVKSAIGQSLEGDHKEHDNDKDKVQNHTVHEEGVGNTAEESLEGQITTISALEDDDDSPNELSVQISKKLDEAKECLNEMMTQKSSKVICAPGIDLDCTPGLDLEGLLKALSGMMQCGGNAAAFKVRGAASMDSTIFTSGSINL